MTAPLDQREQTNLNHLNALQAEWDANPRAPRPGLEAEIRNARAQHERDLTNAEARARRLGQMDAEAQAQRAAAQQRRDEQAAQQVEAFRQQARATFPGTGAEFDAAWPEIKRQWQIRQTLGGGDDALARKRQMYGDF